MSSHDVPDATPAWYVPQPLSPIGVYDSETIKDIQRTLSCPQTGVMDARTISHIKGLQHIFGLTATGVIDLDTAIQIERLRSRYAVQE